MADIEWVAVESILMTSEPIPAYGGLVIPRTTLEDLAGSLRPEDLSMHLDHDLSKPLRIRNPRIWVQERADGVHLLRLDYEILSTDLDLVGERKGMSATIHVPIPGHEGFSDRQQPLVEIAADSAWFSDEALLSAQHSLTGSGLKAAEARVQRAFQFSAVPDPQVYVTLIPELLLGLGVGLLGNMLWDAIKLLLRSRKTPESGAASTQTIVNLRIEGVGRSLTGVVQTNSDAVAERAIEAFEVVAREFVEGGSLGGKQVVTWNDATREWIPPS